MDYEIKEGYEAYMKKSDRENEDGDDYDEDPEYSGNTTMPPTNPNYMALGQPTNSYRNTGNITGRNAGQKLPVATNPVTTSPVPKSPWNNPGPAKSPAPQPQEIRGNRPARENQQPPNRVTSPRNRNRNNQTQQKDWPTLSTISSASVDVEQNYQSPKYQNNQANAPQPTRYSSYETTYQPRRNNNGNNYQGGDQDQGYRGHQGYRGDQGHQGQGYRGDQGQGYRGDQGQGYRGDQGQGYRGDQGQGYRGNRGQQGYRGDRGNQGYRGNRGSYQYQSDPQSDYGGNYDNRRNRGDRDQQYNDRNFDDRRNRGGSGQQYRDNSIYVHEKFYENPNPIDYDNTQFKRIDAIEMYMIHGAYTSGGAIKSNVTGDDLVLLKNFSDLAPVYDPEVFPEPHLKITRNSPNDPEQIRIVSLHHSVIYERILIDNAADMTDEEFSKEFVKTKFPIVEGIYEQLYNGGVQAPSGVQELVIPKILLGPDAIVQFKAGQGKTLAYAIPMVWHLDPRDPSLQLLIIVPTKELVSQVYTTFKTIAPVGTKIARCTGISDRNGNNRDNRDMVDSQGFQIVTNKSGDQHTALIAAREAQIIIATMGKFMDYMGKKAISTEHLKMVCIDECDALVTPNSRGRNNLEFQQHPGNSGCDPASQIRTMMSRFIPPQTQRIFISATITDEPGQIIYNYCRTSAVGNEEEPFIILLDQEDQTHGNIIQYYVYTQNLDDKLGTLRDILTRMNLQQAIVFVNSHENVMRVHNVLVGMNLPVGRLSGQMSPSEREQVFARYKESTIKILIATDVASRGVDIPGVSLVINFDLPANKDTLCKDYIHRIGRTGRFGKGGTAITFVIANDTMNEEAKLREIMKHSTNSAIQALPPLDQLSNVW